MAFSSDWSLVALASPDAAQIWDVATGWVKTTLECHYSWFSAVALSPDESLVASGLKDGTIQLWDVVTGQLKATLKGPCDFIKAIAFSPDGSLLASGSEDNTVRLWDVATGASIYAIRHTFVSSLRFSSDGMLLDIGVGQLRLPPDIFISARSQPQSPTLSYRKPWVYDERGRKLIWVPPEYQPKKVAVRGRVLVGGCSDGRVWFLETWPM